MSKGSMTVFGGNANPHINRLISQHLGLPLGQATISKFSDGEINVELKENVRGKDVFFIQPTCAPTNDNLMELMVFVDALKRSSADRITVVIPYFGYSRQDRRPRSARVPISAKVVANMIAGAGVDRVLTIDLHADQIQGFFDIPVDNIYATPILLNDLLSLDLDSPMIVSPDVGGVLRARAMVKRVPNAAFAIIDKRRPKANESEIMNIIGEEIEGKDCVLIDDMVDTAGTLGKAASALKEQGARTVRAYCSHAVLSGDAFSNIEESGLDELVVTDTIPLTKELKKSKKIRVISIAGLVAETIRRIHVEESISTLFAE